MRRIWLHIGLPKTASTAAQVALYHLDDPLIRYARLAPNVDHNTALHAAADGDAEAIAQLEAALDLDRRDVILSSEALAQTPARAAPLLDLLRRHADRVVVLCVVRNLADYVPSMFIHRMPEILADLRSAVRSPRPWLPYGYFNQFKAIVAWMQQCADDDFRLVDYDAARAASPASALLARMDRPDIRTDNPRINGTLTMEGVSVLMALIADTDIAPSLQLDLLWARLLRGFGNRRLRLDPAALHAALFQARDDIMTIESRLGRSLSMDIASPDAFFLTHPEELVLAGRRYIEPFCDHLRTVWRWSVPALSTPEAFLAWFDAHLTSLTELDTGPDGFDPEGYVRINPDIATSGMDPAEHYRLHGFLEQRQI